MFYMEAHRLVKTMPLESLRKEWSLFALFSMFFLAAGFTLLTATWQLHYATRWTLLAAIALVYQLSILWRFLHLNHRVDETQLLSSLGWGNRLTLLRGILIGGLIGFLAIPAPPGWLAWLPGIFYTLAIAADFFDGYLARITRRTTRLGELLDMSFDGLGVLAAILLAVLYGRLPGWYLLVALARYAFVFGLWLRKRLGKPNYELPPSIRRRALAGFQMGFLAVMLWPLFTPPGTHIVALLFGVPILLGFIQDWFYVSGWLKPGLGAPSVSLQFGLRWLPFLLRITLVFLGASLILPNLPNFAQLPAPQAAIAIADIVVISLLAFGITTRSAAIAGLILLGFHQIYASLSLAQILMAAGFSAITFLGGGPFSLWTPEEYLVYHRAGKPATVKVEQSG